MEESLTGRIKETFGKNLITESFERLGEWTKKAYHNGEGD
jgi:hypothetical protein